ncbi:MAG TPA: protein kinase, partial [Thermoanaerobaculia bacterium]
FGLAKLKRQGFGDSDDSATASAPEQTLTSPGALVGTVQYMSPEQAKGEPATAASDQFALGAILYEMVTGRAPFGRSSNGETLSAILRDDPEPISSFRVQVPAPFQWVIDRCLAKSPSDRYVSTRDLARELQNLRSHSESAANLRSPSAKAPRRRGLWRLAAAVALVAIGGAAALLFRPRPPAPREPDFRRLTFRHGVVWRALFVPRADAILYTATWPGSSGRVFLTIPESSGVDRSLEAEAQLPMAYSGDGSQVLVLLGRTRAAINVVGTLAWWPALGGQPRPILQNAGWADWSEASGRLAVVRYDGAARVLELRGRTGDLERSLFRTTGGISYVRFSPDGRHVAFIHHPIRYDNAGEVRVVETEGSGGGALTGHFERCAGLDWNGRTGEIWFTATRENLFSTTLWRVAPGGVPKAIHSMPGVFALQDVSPEGDRHLLIASISGRSMVLRRSDGPTSDLTWLGHSTAAQISPDGESVLFEDGGASEKSHGAWVRPLSGGDAVRLGGGSPGAFSPDGRSIVATTSPRTGPPQIVLIPVGAGAARVLTSSGATHSSPSFAGEDEILFVRSDAGTSEVWRMAKDGSSPSSLGARGCDLPQADPSGRSFLARCGEGKIALHVFPLGKGEGRALHARPDGAEIIAARWDASGRRIFAVTQNLRFVTIDAASGAVLAEEPIDLGEPSGADSLRTAAIGPDASRRVYSFDRYSSGLYLADGL